METKDLLKTIFDEIKNDPIAPCPYNTMIICDVPPRLNEEHPICCFLDECLVEWEETGKSKSKRIDEK